MTCSGTLMVCSVTKAFTNNHVSETVMSPLPSRFHTVKHIQPVRRELGQTWQRPEKQGMFGVMWDVKISIEKNNKHLQREIFFRDFRETVVINRQLNCGTAAGSGKPS